MKKAIRLRSLLGINSEKTNAFVKGTLLKTLNGGYPIIPLLEEIIRLAPLNKEAEDNNYRYLLQLLSQAADACRISNATEPRMMCFFHLQGTEVFRLSGKLISRKSSLFREGCREIK